MPGNFLGLISMGVDARVTRTSTQRAHVPALNALDKHVDAHLTRACSSMFMLVFQLIKPPTFLCVCTYSLLVHICFFVVKEKNVQNRTFRIINYADVPAEIVYQAWLYFLFFIISLVSVYLH